MTAPNTHEQRFSPAGVQSHVTAAPQYEVAFSGSAEISFQDAFQRSTQGFSANGQTFVVATLLFGAITWVLSSFFSVFFNLGIELLFTSSSSTSEFFLIPLKQLAVSVPGEAFIDGILLEGMALSLALMVVGGKVIDFNDAFAHFKKAPALFLASFGAAFIAGFFSLLLVVPGIIAMCLLTFTQLLVLDKDETPLNAMKISSKAVWANKVALLPIFAALLGAHLMSLFSCGFAGLVTIPLAALLLVDVYRTIFDGAAPILETER